jgi:hypothetical protein
MSTRFALCAGLCALSLAAALATSFVQCENHARAQRLAALQRRVEMLSAANAQMRATATAHVFGVPNAELDVVTRRARAPLGGTP